jgi:hypothetical protein
VDLNDRSILSLECFAKKEEELFMSKRYQVLILCLGCFLILSGESFSMIKTLPVTGLVSQSDYNVIGEVQKIEVYGTDSSKMGKIKLSRNEIIVKESLKGAWSLDKPMIFRTIKAERWIEDNVEFPFPGTQVLLFVKQGGSESVNLVNGIQGLWPIQDGKLLRMGTGKTLEDIRAIIRSQTDSRK